MITVVGIVQSIYNMKIDSKLSCIVILTENEEDAIKEWKRWITDKLKLSVVEKLSTDILNDTTEVKFLKTISSNTSPFYTDEEAKEYIFIKD